MRVLFIGNSLTYWHCGLDGVFSRWGLVAAAETMPGATLAKLWKAGAAKQRILEACWDVVVLQDDLPEYRQQRSDTRSRAAFVTERLSAVSELFIGAIIEARAKPVFLMAHPYQRLAHTTLEDIVVAHRALEALHADRAIAVAPGALAHHLAQAHVDSGNRQVVEPLHLLEPDEEHPSEEGMYLHAVTIAMAMGMEAAFLERWTPAGMSESVRELLQQAAAESLAEWKANAI